MRRLIFLVVGLTLIAGTLTVRGQNPDDLFIDFYSLIQQADVLRDTGRRLEAREKYEQARNILLRIKSEYPYWNPKILDYRLGYIAEQIGPLPEEKKPA
ncbi:MAG TPA: hypothetical protein PLW35_02055, partial [Verrucomicrobiota bacterium]|nr:hypothetical protein [Verrucomicrobiota bacterium]